MPPELLLLGPHLPYPGLILLGTVVNGSMDPPKGKAANQLQAVVAKRQAQSRCLVTSKDKIDFRNKTMALELG